MITSGLLITLSEEPHLARQALAALRARPEVTLGQRTRRWLPLATEVADGKAGHDLHDWLGQLPGVEFVDVVQVNFDDAATSAPASEEMIYEH